MFEPPTRCCTKALTNDDPRRRDAAFNVRVASFFLQAIGPSRSLDAGQE